MGAIVGSYLVLVDSFQKTKNRGKGGERGGKEEREKEKEKGKKRKKKKEDDGRSK